MAACVVLTRPVPASLVSPLPPYFPCKVPPPPSQVPPPTPSSPSSANATSAPAPLVLRRRPSRQHLRFGSGKYSLFLSQFLPIQFKQSHFSGARRNMSSICELVIKFRYFQSTMGAVQLNGLVVKMNVISRRAVVERPVGSSVAQVVLRAAPHARSQPSSHGNSNDPIQWTNLLFWGSRSKVLIHISNLPGNL